MRTADALVSAALGGTLWTLRAGLIACCGRRLRQVHDDGLLGGLPALLLAGLPGFAFRRRSA